MVEKVFWGYTCKQWKLFAILSLVNLINGLVYSIPAPFYPKEAEAKGSSATAYGFVLGVYELVNFITSPIFGIYMDKLGPIRLFHSGVLLAGIMTIAFGFLHFINGALLFIIISFLIRIPQAVGGSAIITSSVTIVTVEFSHAVATTFAAIETFFGVGFCIGPTVGAFLYEAGGASYGFPLPFIIMGTLLLLSLFFSSYAFWGHNFGNEVHGVDFDLSDNFMRQGLASLLKIPDILLNIFAVIVTSMGVGFLSTLLEPHLRLFNLTPVVLGLCYLLYGSVYAITAPIWGILCDRMSDPKYITLIGGFFVLFAWIFIGPAPFIPFPPVFWVTCLSLVIFGLGIGTTFVSSFILSIRAAKKNRFPDNMSTHALVSGVWRSSLALGSFIGPSIAGVLYDLWGFRYESLVIIVLELILVVFILFSLSKDCVTSSNSRKRNRNNSICSSSSGFDSENIDERTPIFQNPSTVIQYN